MKKTFLLSILTIIFIACDKHNDLVENIQGKYSTDNGLYTATIIKKNTETINMTTTYLASMSTGFNPINVLFNDVSVKAENDTIMLSKNDTLIGKIWLDSLQITTNPSLIMVKE